MTWPSLRSRTCGQPQRHRSIGSENEAHWSLHQRFWVKISRAPRLNFCLWLGDTSLRGGLVCGTDGAMGPSDAKGSCSAASFLKECEAARLGAYATGRRQTSAADY